MPKSNESQDAVPVVNDMWIVIVDCGAVPFSLVMILFLFVSYIHLWSTQCYLLHFVSAYSSWIVTKHFRKLSSVGIWKKFFACCSFYHATSAMLYNLLLGVINDLTSLYNLKTSSEVSSVWWVILSLFMSPVWVCDHHSSYDIYQLINWLIDSCTDTIIRKITTLPRNNSQAAVMHSSDWLRSRSGYYGNMTLFFYRLKVTIIHVLITLQFLTKKAKEIEKNHRSKCRSPPNLINSSLPNVPTKFHENWSTTF